MRIDQLDERIEKRDVISLDFFCRSCTMFLPDGPIGYRSRRTVMRVNRLPLRQNALREGITACSRRLDLRNVPSIVALRSGIRALCSVFLWYAPLLRTIREMVFISKSKYCMQ